jgi:hypothetical protein
MGLKTLADWRTELGTTAQGALQRSNIGTTLVDRWVNEALREVAYAFKFHELEASVNFSTVIGTPAYLLTVAGITNSRYIEEMWVTDPDTGIATRVRPETRTRYRKNLGVLTDTETYSTPKWYHRFASSLYMRPAPDKVYTVSVDYGKLVNSLTAPADASQLLEDWDECISMGALYRGFRHFGEYDRYQNVRGDFLGLVRSRQTEYQLEEFAEGGITPIGPNDTEDTEEMA